jgi:hypothetical protein
MYKYFLFKSTTNICHDNPILIMSSEGTTGKSTGQNRAIAKFTQGCVALRPVLIHTGALPLHNIQNTNRKLFIMADGKLI